MPRGFSGPHAVDFLTRASIAHSQAQASSGRTTTTAPVPDRMATQTGRLTTRPLPFSPEDGNSSGFVSTGRGTSDNVVVDRQEYESISRVLSHADERIGECIYNISNEVEALCQTAFILPTAVPRCMNISDSVKRTLGEFRSVTEDSVIQIRSFAREITEIG